MNHTVWQPVLDQLPEWIEAKAIDLPGHGQRFNESFADFNALLEDMRDCCEAHKQAGRPLIVVAWSLGALPFMTLSAKESSLGSPLIDALMLVSSNPCFVSRKNWSSGISADVFDQFAISLKADFSGTIRRFLSLQVKGSDSGRRILRDLREKILQQPQPDAKSLDAGLEILKNTDLCDQLQQITKPVSWVLGAQDGLVKAGLANELKTLMQSEEIKVYDKAGHAPFLSHTEEFLQQLTRFVSGVIKNN